LFSVSNDLFGKSIVNSNNESKSSPVIAQSNHLKEDSYKADFVVENSKEFGKEVKIVRKIPSNVAIKSVISKHDGTRFVLKHLSSLKLQLFVASNQNDQTKASNMMNKVLVFIGSSTYF